MWYLLSLYILSALILVGISFAEQVDDEFADVSFQVFIGLIPFVNTLIILVMIFAILWTQSAKTVRNYIKKRQRTKFVAEQRS